MPEGRMLELEGVDCTNPRPALELAALRWGQGKPRFPQTLTQRNYAEVTLCCTRMLWSEGKHYSWKAKLTVLPSSRSIPCNDEPHFPPRRCPPTPLPADKYLATLACSNLFNLFKKSVVFIWLFSLI